MTQMSLFSRIPEPGSFVENFRGPLTFEELYRSVGRTVVWDVSTQSKRVYQLVRVADAWVDCDGERGITLDFGRRRRGFARECSFRLPHPCRAYEMEEDA